MVTSQFFVYAGYLKAGELEQKTGHYRANPDAPLPDKPNPAIATQISDYLLKGDSGLHEPAVPRFAAGDEMRIGDPRPVDHTPLPRYFPHKTRTIHAPDPGHLLYFVSPGVAWVTEP